MECVKCGHAIVEGAAFCPYCGEKVARGDSGPETPIYQADVKGLLKSGKLVVYRDRTEFVTSSVQKAVFAYAGLVAIKKGWDSIDFVTEDGRTESCPAGRKTVHEAFLYIEKMFAPYEAQRKERLLSRGVQYSFPSSQGLMSSGVLDISAQQVEFKAKSGKSEIVSYRDVKSVGASMGTLDLNLFGGGTKSFAVSKEMRDEVLAYVTASVAPFLAQRKADLLSRGIYFSFYAADGGTVDILADRVEYKGRSGQVESCVSFPDIRVASTYTGMLELGLTDGTNRSFPVDEEESGEVLAFVKEAIAPYVAARTEGFDAAFGVDEKIEINAQRGVFHILRQSGREITGEWPLTALERCEWVESKELNALGSVVSGGIAIFKTAAKAAGNQAVAEAEDRISCAGVVLTLPTGEEKVWFGIFTAGMSRTNKKFERYLEEWQRLAEYLASCCPGCELVEPEPLSESVAQTPGAGMDTGSSIAEFSSAPAETGAPETVKSAAAPAQQSDDLGIAKYIEGVSRFIGSCATPMTIAFQGNRGSGENSILKMLFDRMGERYGDNLLWLNARLFSQNESGDALSISEGKKLVELFHGGNDPEAKNRAANIASGVIKLVAGTIVSEKSAVDDLVDGIFEHSSAETVDQLVRLFSRQVEARTQGGNDKVVLFVDGLDQIAPARAVELLNAMRNFLDQKGCVFVIAASYDNILAGAQAHYDESKAKRFFDETFKMSFRVPAFSYNVQGYAKSKLEAMGLPTGDEEELGLYAALIQTSVGRDPEFMDRLFHSFQLLKDMVNEEEYESRYKRLALFALLCMQTKFRDVYDYAARMRDRVTPEFLADLCGESTRLWDAVRGGEEEKAAYQGFGRVLARIVDQDGRVEISPAECQAFAEVLELSGITSR